MGKDEDRSLVATAAGVPAAWGADGEDSPIGGHCHRAASHVGLVIFSQAQGASPGLQSVYLLPKHAQGCHARYVWRHERAVAPGSRCRIASENAHTAWTRVTQIFIILHPRLNLPHRVSLCFRGTKIGAHLYSCLHCPRRQPQPSRRRIWQRLQRWVFA